MKPCDDVDLVIEVDDRRCPVAIVVTAAGHPLATFSVAKLRKVLSDVDHIEVREEHGL